MDDNVARVVFAFVVVAIIIGFAYFMARLNIWQLNGSRKKKIKSLFPLTEELSKNQKDFLIQDLERSIVSLESDYKDHDDQQVRAARVADHLKVLLTNVQNDKLSSSDIDQLNNIYKKRL